MEERRLKITRKTGDTIRSYIADIIKRSVTNLRGEYPSQIQHIIDNLTFDQSHIPSILLNEGDLFSERTINNIFELLYIDLVIQYGDIFNIQDILREMHVLFESVICANVTRASQCITRAKDYKAFSKNQFSFTDVFHESFNAATNHITSNYACEINNGAGLLRMAGTTEHFARIETSDIKLKPYSTAVKVIDENDPQNAYTDDMTEPYFITVFSTGNPKNNDAPAAILSSYNGLIVDIIITFNTVIPVTRIAFTPFSTAPIDIIGIFYSVIPDGNWALGDMRIARLWNMTYDTDEIEINFPRIYVRELHIVVHQSAYNLLRTDIEIEENLSVKDYIAAVNPINSQLIPEGFKEHENISMHIDELSSFLNKMSSITGEKPAPNTRSYVIGLTGLCVCNVSYMHTSSYQGKPRQLHGNLHAVNFLHEGTITHGDTSVVDSCALFSIETAGKTIYVGYTANDGRVVDGAIVQVHCEYNKGAMEKDKTHPYMFETHFRPTQTFSGLELYHNGERYILPPESIIERRNYNAKVALPKEFCISHNLFEGTIITMLYEPDSYDMTGKPYSVSHASIPSRIGKPHIAVNEARYIQNSYLYITTPSGSISYAPSLSAFLPGEWSEVMIRGELYYRVTENKGLPLNSTTIFEHAGNFYIHEDCVSGPFDDFYYGSINEKPEYIVSSGTIQHFKTEVPYIKGTLTVFHNEQCITETDEYTVDTVTTVLTNDEKRIFTIPSYYEHNNITVCYIPIDSEESTGSIGTNIAPYTDTENHRETTHKKITLRRFPYIDPDIISSPSFAFHDGVFYLKQKYSITYEPVMIFVNGTKAINITDYQKGMRNTPQFGKSYREDDYRFYLKDGNTVVFNKDITGTIIVYYYQLSDIMREQVEMYRSNYNRDDITPEITSYTILADICK